MRTEYHLRRNTQHFQKHCNALVTICWDCHKIQRRHQSRKKGKTHEYKLGNIKETKSTEENSCKRYSRTFGRYFPKQIDILRGSRRQRSQSISGECKTVHELQANNNERRMARILQVFENTKTD
nr:MAG TPA: hypothetical protein [Caudoviricetes sp.]